MLPGSSSSSDAEEEVWAAIQEPDAKLRAALAEEREAAALPTAEREDQRHDYYTQMVGALFVWAVETTLFAAVHYCVYLGVEAVLGGGTTLIARWCSVNVLVSSVAMLALNYALASAERSPGIFSRHHMMCTQAYCGLVSCLGTVFSAVAWQATRSAVWRDTFVQSDSGLLPAALVVLAVVNNVQWVLSLVLTFSCTPFGQTNSAFLQVPVAAALVLFLVLLNEAATNQLAVCPDTSRATLAYGGTNIAIVSSFVLHVLSAVEFDPAGLFPAWMHSRQASRSGEPGARIRFDVYALLHGVALSFVLLCYGAVASLTRTTFYATLGVLAFTGVVTLAQALDLRHAAAVLLRGDDDDEAAARALAAEQAAQFRAAAAQAAAARGKPRGKARRASLIGLPVPRGAEPEVDLQAEADRFRRRNRRVPLPTALALFPNIPVSMRRSAH
jgi:hypothetical protein